MRWFVRQHKRRVRARFGNQVVAAIRQYLAQDIKGHYRSEGVVGLLKFSKVLARVAGGLSFAFEERPFHADTLLRLARGEGLVKYKGGSGCLAGVDCLTVRFAREYV